MLTIPRSVGLMPDERRVGWYQIEFHRPDGLLLELVYDIAHVFFCYELCYLVDSEEEV